MAAALAITGLLVLSGCLTADSTMQADGSGTMTLTYPPPGGASKASETKRFTSDAVTVESLTMAADGKTATVKLKFTDATKLVSAKALRNLSITRTPGDGTEKVTIVIKPDLVVKLTPEQVKDEPPLKIKVTLPGTVREANAKAATDGATVTWTIPVGDFLANPSTEMTVTYEVKKA
jgi:hypothetical protein